MNKNSCMLNLIDRFLADDQNRTALKLYNGRQITDVSFRDFAGDILDTAGSLAENGIVHRHIALVGPSGYEWLVAFFAILVSGNVGVPLNPALPADVQQAQCALADVYAVCGETDAVAKIAGARVGIDYADMHAKTAFSIADAPRPQPEDTALLLFTNGTTGQSKAAEITYINLESSLVSAEGVFSADGMEKIMSVLPLYHIAGLRGMLAMLYRFRTMCLSRGPMYLFQDLRAFSPSYVHLVPMMAESVAKILKNAPKKEDRAKFLGSDLCRICIGGASVHPDICSTLIREGITIDIGYAMTETTGVGTWGQWDAAHPNTVGLLSDELACRVEDGELLFKGRAVMKGYYKDPAATQEVIEDGWLHSGDLGFCDAEGRYFITGRKKNLIVMPNGEKINPEELERQLMDGKAISECMIHHNGQVLCADVFAQDREQAAERIARYNSDVPLPFRIHTVRYLDQPLSRTGIGKLHRNGMNT
ncbi:MAG: AMP-binding protein [Clostridia bacterium]|nr:AMP-binding protein [Clostridia bacterium]